MKTALVLFVVLVVAASGRPALAESEVERSVVDDVFETTRLQQALDLREATYRQAFYLGTELYLQGEYEAALSEFRRAYQQRRHANVLFAIGQCFAAQGRYTEAILQLRRSVEQGLERPELAHRRIREIQRAAMQELEAAVGLDLDDTESRERRRVALASRPSARLICRQSSLAPETVRRIVQLHQNELRGLYERARVADHDLAGRIVVRFAIGLDGRVQSVETIERTLDNEAINEAVIERFHDFVFPARECGDVLVVTYPLNFLPRPTNGERLVIDPRPPIVVTGALSSIAVRDVVRGVTDQLLEEYDAALSVDPELRTRFVVRFNIAEDGTVYEPMIVAYLGISAHPELQREVRRLIDELRFPEAEEDTTVVCPIEFRPPDDETDLRVITP